jgi:DNA-binding NtrC family response regulator
LTRDRSLIVVEDDEGFARTLKRSFERRGYDVVLAASIEEVRQVLEERSFGHAVVDLKLGGASGLACVELLHAHDPEMLIVVLTGFATIWQSPRTPTTSRPPSTRPEATPRSRSTRGRPRSRRWNGSVSTRR